LPRQLEPKGIEVAYSKELRAFVDVAREALKRILLPQLPSLLEQAAFERGDSAWHEDASARRVRELMGQVKDTLSKAVNDNQLERLARDMGNRTSRFQREQLDKQVRAAVGVDVFAAEPALGPLSEAFVESNVALIKSIPEQAFSQVETLVQQAVRGGARHEQLAKDIEGRFEVAESRAALIARDQTLKFYGELNKARQQALGVDAYIWRSTPDNRTRPEHEERDGKRYLWSEPPADGHPGSAVNCRCNAEPDLQSALEALEASESTATAIKLPPVRRARRPKVPVETAPVPAPAPKPNIDDIPAGGLDPDRPGFENKWEKRDYWEYTHTLSEENRAAGYSAQLESVERTTGEVPNLISWAYDAKGAIAGKVDVDVKDVDGKPAIYVQFTQVEKGNEGKKLGQQLVEAAIVHARKKYGVTHVSGGVHSTLAHKMHLRMSAKYGWDYSAELRPGMKDVPEGEFDDRYGKYLYRIK
jgi:SPP1 gp7 family putative phage head morphogenesis protein